MRKILLTTAVLALSGCASIVGGGSRQNVSFTSTPPGAKVIIDGAERGVTPTMIELKRKDEHMVRIELAGYQPYDVALKRGVNGWVWGNIILGGIPGLIVDAITGAMYKLKPGDVGPTLTAKTASRTGDQLYIGVVLQAEPGWEKIGQLTPAVGR